MINDKTAVTPCSLGQSCDSDSLRSIVFHGHPRVDTSVLNQIIIILINRYFRICKSLAMMEIRGAVERIGIEFDILGSGKNLDAENGRWTWVMFG